MTRAVTLNEAMGSSRAAGLDHIRLFAAVSVVISHSWSLSLGKGTNEPLQVAFGYSLGGIAVLIFFFMSGVLIANSAARNQHRKLRFAGNRIRRIFPGLAVALMVTVALSFACGATPVLLEVVIYLTRGLSLVFLQNQLSGAFADNPYPTSVNGPLWTLFYEATCYVLIAFLVWLFARTKLMLPLLIVSILLCLWGTIFLIDLPEGPLINRLRNFAPLGYIFLTGALAWHQKDCIKLRFDWAIGVLALGALICSIYPSRETCILILGPAIGYCVLTYGHFSDLPSLPIDLSYGIYIYGWPVAQTIIYITPPLHPMILAGLTLIAVVPIASLSWIFVERPFLQRLKLKEG